MYVARSIGGGLFLVGWLLMFSNLIVTAMSGKAVNVEVEVQALNTKPLPTDPSTTSLVFSKPVVMCFLGLFAATMFAMPNIGLAVLGLVMLLAVVAFASGMLFTSLGKGKHTWHDMIESRPLAFSVLTLIAVLLGGLFELLPGLITEKKVPLTASGEVCVQPYTALELAGRDIFVREGCYVCHSQMIRPFRSEQLRYGPPSRIEESMYDHPFQWGSKRTGPDLARIGTKYAEAWHWEHMKDPRYGAPYVLGESQSIMPAYPWLYDDKVEVGIVADKMSVLKKLGTPYTDEQLQNVAGDYQKQAAVTVSNLATQKVTGADPNSEIVALIAYLMRLGKNLEPADHQPAAIEGGK
jgi:cytochrome c oxidase cbb3-type subunit I/II